MFKYFLRRLLVTLLTIVGAMVLLFIIIQFLPGDPASVMLGPRATPEIIEEMRAKMWLDRPVYQQLARFLFNVIRGDLGRDVLNHMSVRKQVMNVLPHTIALSTISILIATIIGIPLGTFSAAKRNSLIDRITGFFSISMIAIPPFLAGVLFLLIFSVYLNWFPSMGGGEEGNLMSQIWHLVLPTFSLALGWIGYIARIMRASVLEELRKDYVNTARSKGLKEYVVIFRHAVRGALIPVIAVLGVGFGNLLGGAVLVEIIFHRHGLGNLLYNAIQSRNFPVVQGGLIIAVFLYSIANLIADLSYGFFDPRLRSE